MTGYKKNTLDRQSLSIEIQIQRNTVGQITSNLQKNVCKLWSNVMFLNAELQKLYDIPS